MSTLPGGLAGPLHLLRPLPFQWVGLGILLLILLGILLHRRRRRPLGRARARGSPRARPTGERGATAERIGGIRRQGTDCGEYREGCHLLSATLRQHFEDSEALPWTHLTAAEISRQAGQRPAATVIQLLADLQFARRAPEREEFENICDLALTVVPRVVRPAGAESG